MRSAYLGADGLAAGAHPGLVAIDMGTFPVPLKRELADALAGKGAAMLDSPVSGTPPVVRAREAVLFVSGDEAAIERCRPILDAITPNHRTVGAFGAGMAVKWAANLLVTVQTFATAQAMLLGTRSGIDPQVLIEAIGASFASSPVFRSRAPLMAEARYQPAAGPAHVFLKDLGYIDAECRRLGIAAPLIGPTLEWYARLVEAGRGNDEGAAIYELLKGRAGPSSWAVRPPGRSCRSGRWPSCAPAPRPPATAGRSCRSAGAACPIRSPARGRRGRTSRSRAPRRACGCGR